MCVDWGKGGKKARVELKDRRRNEWLKAGRDVKMDDSHMEDIRNIMHCEKDKRHKKRRVGGKQGESGT